MRGSRERRRATGVSLLAAAFEETTVRRLARAREADHDDGMRHVCEYPPVGHRVVVVLCTMVVGRVAEVVSRNVARRVIARGDSASEFVPRRSVVGGDEDVATAADHGLREPLPFSRVVAWSTRVETYIAPCAPSLFLKPLWRAFEVVADRADMRSRREGARRSGGGSLVGARADAGQRGQPSSPVCCFKRGPEDSPLYPRHASLFAPGWTADGLEGIRRE